jgi:DIE2/ALG10 family
MPTVPHPSIQMQDEVYHVRQTQRFCAGSLEYDPMITTFPGVYIVGVAWSQTLRLISWAPALLYSTPPLPMVQHRTAQLCRSLVMLATAMLPTYAMHLHILQLAPAHHGPCAPAVPSAVPCRILLDVR